MSCPQSTVGADEARERITAALDAVDAAQDLLPDTPSSLAGNLFRVEVVAGWRPTAGNPGPDVLHFRGNRRRLSGFLDPEAGAYSEAVAVTSPTMRIHVTTAPPPSAAMTR